MQARARTGVMLQEGSLPATLRVCELIELFSSYYPAPLPIGEVVEGGRALRIGAAAVRQTLRRTEAASHDGARSLRQPGALFLDEPTAGLDTEARRLVWAGVRNFVSTRTFRAVRQRTTWRSGGAREPGSSAAGRDHRCARNAVRNQGANPLKPVGRRLCRTDERGGYMTKRALLRSWRWSEV